MLPRPEHWLVELAILAFKIFCSILILMAMLMTIWIVGPRIESAWFPVVSKLRIDSMKVLPDGGTEIYVSFTKLRNCEYRGISWFRQHSVDGFERVPVMILRRPGDESSPNRPIGLQKSGPWVVQVSPEELRKNSFAKLYHQCHLLWLTVTDFYP